MFGMSSYEKVYMMRKSFTHVDTLQMALDMFVFPVNSGTVRLFMP